MFVETIEQRVRLVRPRSFAGLMTLYESNHVRLKQLLGNLRRLPESAVSVAGDLPRRALESAGRNRPRRFWR